MDREGMMLMETLTPEQITRLQELEQAATPGPLFSITKALLITGWDLLTGKIFEDDS